MTWFRLSVHRSFLTLVLHCFYLQFLWAPSAWKLSFCLQCSSVFCSCWPELFYLALWLNGGLRCFGCETLWVLGCSLAQLLSEDVKCLSWNRHPLLCGLWLCIDVTLGRSSCQGVSSKISAQFPNVQVLALICQADCVSVYGGSLVWHCVRQCGKNILYQMNPRLTCPQDSFCQPGRRG